MNPLLVGWLVLMAQLDGVEMIFRETEFTNSAGGKAGEGHVAARVAYGLRPDPWALREESACFETRARLARKRIPEDRDHASSESAPYDDGTVSP